MKKIQVWLPLLFAIVMIVGMRIGFKLRSNIPSTQNFFDRSKRSSLQEVMDLVRLKYVDKINTDTLTEDAVHAMLSNLDPHSVYIPATHLSEVNEDLQGNFEGIGVEYQIILDTVHVVSVLQAGPSDKAGLRVGDKFIRVGDITVAGTSITSEKIKKLLRGPGGSKINVVILRENTTQTVTITRGTIPVYSVNASYMIDSETGFIHLNKFTGTSYEEFMQALERLKGEGLKQLIFDLRDNGGGILGEAVDITDEFLDGNKLIVYTQGDKQPRYEYRSKRPGLFEKGKLVLLVDEGSASASEVVAGALQDWDRATIVGRRTFGKGLVQEQYELSDGSALRLTVSRYYTPTGRSIQKPYINGRDAYNDEVLQRFQNGEVIHPDTMKGVTRKVYKTKGGRAVYGSGGITPDIFVAFDTATLSNDIASLFYNQTFGKFVYTCYTQNKVYFSQFKNPSDFATRYKPTDAVWNKLKGYLGKDSLKVRSISPKDKSELQHRFKTWMARQIWKMEGYYEVNNLHDRMVQTALQELRDNEEKR